MEGLILVGLIIWGIYALMGGGCEHEWESENSTYHKCKKCKKKERHTLYESLRPAGTYGGMEECEGCDYYRDDDDW